MRSCLFKTWQAFSSFLFFQCLSIYSSFKLPLVHSEFTLPLTNFVETVHSIGDISNGSTAYGRLLASDLSWQREEQRRRENWKKIQGDLLAFFSSVGQSWLWALLQQFAAERSGWLHTLAPHNIARTVLSLPRFTAIYKCWYLDLKENSQRWGQQVKGGSTIWRHSSGFSSLISRKVHIKVIRVHIYLLSLLIYLSYLAEAVS